MNRAARLFVVVVIGLVAGLRVASASVGDRVPLSREHVDLRIIYAPGTTNELYLIARDEDHATNYASTNVVLVVGAAAEVELPEGFPEFGEPGAPFWILPATQDPQLLYLGVSAEGLPRNTFEEPLAVQLVDVRAPGWFFLYQFDQSGLVMKMDSRNGIGPEDATYPIVGSHEHLNWGFSSNGLYEVTFRVEGRLRGATTNLAAADTTFVFAVEPLPTPPAPATLTEVKVTGDFLTCDLIGESGVKYRIQTSPNLESWADGAEITAEATPVRLAVPGSDGTAPLFLRVVSP
ncbi:MAG TPA: choice-of-anchor M domain-containing protein [Verrucomicrobiota bacterium]|nr:hypothetical protein [Verrucomicrobiales bacterium]HRI15726.1 choice-of-anchor M domain-containing protein [Verrucomicrobiota bacterium]